VMARSRAGEARSNESGDSVSHKRGRAARVRARACRPQKMGLGWGCCVAATSELREVAAGCYYIVVVAPLACRAGGLQAGCVSRCRLPCSTEGSLKKKKKKQQLAWLAWLASALPRECVRESERQPGRKRMNLNWFTLRRKPLLPSALSVCRSVHLREAACCCCLLESPQPLQQQQPPAVQLPQTGKCLPRGKRRGYHW
jgi:hypothetical protein